MNWPQTMVNKIIPPQSPTAKKLSAFPTTAQTTSTRATRNPIIFFSLIYSKKCENVPDDDYGNLHDKFFFGWKSSINTEFLSNVFEIPFNFHTYSLVVNGSQNEQII